MNKTKIQWTTQARDKWCETALYIRREWGVLALRNFKEQTEDCQDKLEVFPEIGKVEPLLKSRNKQYRSLLINELNKIIYYIENNIIWIVDIWDTRREPQNLADGLK